MFGDVYLQSTRGTYYSFILLRGELNSYSAIITSLGPDVRCGAVHAIGSNIVQNDFPTLCWLFLVARSTTSKHHRDCRHSTRRSCSRIRRNALVLGERLISAMTPCIDVVGVGFVTVSLSERRLRFVYGCYLRYGKASDGSQPQQCYPQVM